MKLQDAVFFIIFLILIFLKKSPKTFIMLGLICFILAVPLFAFWVFFTAERLVWYAAAFILSAGIVSLFKNKKA